MVRQNPNLSITLPRNFVFHYTEGDAPKTPEQERPDVTEAPALHRNLHSARPALGARNIFHQNEDSIESSDVSVPSIEPADAKPSGRTNLFRRSVASSTIPNVAQTMRRIQVAPRTPSVEPPLFESGLSRDFGTPARQEFAGDGCSDSSDATDTSDEEDFNSSTNCTSPGYGAVDPFKDGRPAYYPPRRIVRHGFSTIVETPKVVYKKKRATTPWTTEMDKHLLSTWNMYCNDPTNTPFKSIPGCAPPLGACHRVASEVKKTWRGGRSGSSGRHITTESVQSDFCEGSKTIKVKTHSVVWPKSGASTRRRLRALCKRQPVMPSYYARLLESRSPVPPGSDLLDCPYGPYAVNVNELERMLGPPEAGQGSPFRTRRMQFSIATSTATTMQPDAPIVSLTRREVDGVEIRPGVGREPATFPWASPAPIPSDIDAAPSRDDTEMQEKSAEKLESHAEFPKSSRLGSPELPRLASPFNYQTWGPAATYGYERPSTPATSDQDVTMTSPRLAPAFANMNTFPYPATGTQKRRALGELERAMSPDGSDGRSGGPSSDIDLPESSHSATVRRVRIRRPSVDRASIRDSLTSIFHPVGASEQQPELPSIVETSAAKPKTTAASEAGHALPRLASPFAGINARPSRSRRTLSSGSNGVSGGFPSIEERLGDVNRLNPFS